MFSCYCEFSQFFWHLSLPKDANAITFLREMLPEMNLQNIFVLIIWMGCHHSKVQTSCFFGSISCICSWCECLLFFIVLGFRSELDMK